MSAMQSVGVADRKKENTIIPFRSLPTAKFFLCCGELNSIKPNDDIYQCSCGTRVDRNYYAEKNMVCFYENNVGVGRTKFKQVEIHPVTVGSVKRKAGTL